MKPAPVQKALLSLAAAAVAVSLNAPPAIAAEDLTITFRASRNPEISKVQRALVEAWGMPCHVRLTTGFTQRPRRRKHGGWQFRVC